MTLKQTLNRGIILSTLLTSLVFAYPNPPHTWHTVKAVSGTWEAKLQMLNQGGAFVTPAGTILNNFTISPGNPQDYGFSFDSGDDFDVAYTLILTQKTNAPQFFESKTCVYVITASGPAQPDIRVSNFNHAECNYNVIHGRGENFEVA